jgi:hypothetical protein
MMWAATPGNADDTDWVILDEQNNLIDQDENLGKLLERNKLAHYLVTKKWARPAPLQSKVIEHEQH